MSRFKLVIRHTGLRRSHVAMVRMCCERNLLAAFSARRGGERSRILCYHAVGTPAWGVNDVNPRQFRRQIELALEEGYRFVPAAEIARTGGRPKDLAITVDDGLVSVATNAAPILAEYGIPWTLFVVTGWADGEHPWGKGTLLGWRQIEQLAGAGVTIGSHSVTHPNFSQLTHGQVDEELGESRRVIAERIGIAPREFAIPLGTSRDWSPTAGVAAHAAGYDIVYAQSEDRRSVGTIARTFITRLDGDRLFRAALAGAFDRWEEWT